MTIILNGSTGVTFPAGGAGNPVGAVVGTTDTQTLTNKTLTSPTLTNPTLTNPTLTSPTLTSPTISGAVVSAMASSVLTSGTVAATTSGTSIDFLNIPSWAKRITVMFNGVSTSGTSNFLIQSGSGSIENTGYVSNSVYSNSGSSATTSTAGFVINYSTFASSSTAVDGIIILAAMGSNLWAESHTAGSSTNGAALFGAGHKTFSGAIDRIRITTVNGITETFDAGSINIMYE